MANTRSTANSELHDQIALTAHPVNGGSVGVKSPYPEYATFQVDNPNVRLLNGDSNATKVNGLGGVNLNSVWSALNGGSYYREGSRVYFDGGIRQDEDEFTAFNSTLFTLPPEYRPASTRYFVTSCFMLQASDNVPTPDTNGASFTLCVLEIAPTGTVKVNYAVGAYMNAPTKFYSNSERFVLSGIYNSPSKRAEIWLDGINFRVSGTPAA